MSKIMGTQEIKRPSSGSFEKLSGDGLIGG
jgi:hypothetical protein